MSKRTMADPASGAAAHWAAGGLVVLPTETVYGVAASVRNDCGIASLRTLKDAPLDQSFTVHLAATADAERYVEMTPGLQWMLDRLWPGPVTVRVAVGEAVIVDRLAAMGLNPEARDRLYHEGAVSLRCPDHPLARRVLAAAEGPIVATGAHRPSQPPAVEAGAASRALGEDVAMVIDGGRCRFARSSTIVRLHEQGGGTRAVVEREGVYDERIIQRMLSWTVLFVCSGNTCRSPMAAGLARQALARARGMSEADLPAAGIHVASAGVSAMTGAPASESAVDAMRAEGVDLAAHRARPLTAQMVAEADMIYTMTESHRQGVLALDPTAAGKTARLDPEQDIADPIGADMATYQQTATQMRGSLSALLNKESSP